MIEIGLSVIFLAAIASGNLCPDEVSLVKHANEIEIQWQGELNFEPSPKRSFQRGFCQIDLSSAVASDSKQQITVESVTASYRLKIAESAKLEAGIQMYTQGRNDDKHLTFALKPTDSKVISQEQALEAPFSIGCQSTARSPFLKLSLKLRDPKRQASKLEVQSPLRLKITTSDCGSTKIKS